MRHDPVWKATICPENGRKNFDVPSESPVVDLSDRQIGAEIVAACRLGDRDAFRALYDFYKTRVYSIALYFFHGDQAAASDVTQQVFLKLMTSIGQFRGDALFSTWLYRLVVNACMDAARTRKSEAAGSDRSRLESVAGPGSQEQDYVRTQMANLGAGSCGSPPAEVPDRGSVAVLRRSFVPGNGEGASLLHGNGGIKVEPWTQDSGRAAQEFDGDQGIAMFTRHVSRQIAAHIDGELSPQKTGQVERHEARCADCRTEREQIRFGMELLEHLPPVEPPDAIWTSIEAAFQEHSPAGRSAARRLESRPFESNPWRWAFAATAILALAGAAYWTVARHPGTRWDVVRIGGSPVVNQKHIRGEGRIGAGEWIETDSGSSAMVKVGEIGSVEVGPNTRLRVVTALPGEHRLTLAHGDIRAKISAPPKLFFVDTASGTAVDLGCEYTLDADEDGSGLLRVTKGWVSFQWKGLESLVPAGAICRTYPGVGPGIPYFDDAQENLKRALDAFGFEKAGYSALNIVLAEARVRDTLTLWHLLSRVEPEDRARVYDRIASLTPVPPGISREQALKLDPETLRRWKDELAWTW